MGRRQRHSELTSYTDEEVSRQAQNPALDRAIRRKFQQEDKFRRRRNRQKRSK